MGQIFRCEVLDWLGGHDPSQITETSRTSESGLLRPEEIGLRRRPDDKSRAILAGMLGHEARADAKAKIAVRVVAHALRIPGAEDRPLEVLLSSVRERSPSAFEALVRYAEASTVAALAVASSELEAARARTREHVALLDLFRLFR